MTRIRLGLVATVGLITLLVAPSRGFAQTAPSLGSAQSYAVLGGSTVTNTGTTTVTGDLGLSPGSAVTGFPPGIVVSGTIHAADAGALAAQNSATAAYTNLASQACTQDLTGQDLGGKTLTAGVYCFSASAQLTGTLTLNAQGNANAVFIFKIGSALTTASSSSVVMLNGGSSCNVFWQVGSSATLGTTSSMAGNILALTSITATTGASVAGRVLARNGAVTLDTNTINTACVTSPVTPVPPTCPAITLSPATLPNGTVAVAYSQTIVGSGGAAPYSFSLTAGALPTALTLTAAGVLAGTPTTAATSSFTIRGADANGCAASVAYTTIIAAAPVPLPTCPVITLAPPTLPNGTVGVAYSQTITGSGGTAPYSFGVTVGTLPAGLTLTAPGVLAGTPTTAGTSNFTVRGTDANGCFREISAGLVVAAAPVPPAVCPVITLTPSTLPNGTSGVAYTQTIVGSGGTAPYSFGVTVGALPTGLTLTAPGVLAGTPTTAGTSNFTVRGTDANGCFKEAIAALVIAATPLPLPVCPVITIPQTTLPNMAVGVAYGLTLTATGGTAPYSWGLTAGALPAGMTLTSAGVLAGTPTTAGTVTFTIRATDANGCFAEIVYTMILPTPVPTLPQVFVVLLALGLAGVGYVRLRRQARAG